VLRKNCSVLKGSLNRLETTPHEAEVSSSNPPPLLRGHVKKKKKIVFLVKKKKKLEEFFLAFSFFHKSPISKKNIAREKNGFRLDSISFDLTFFFFLG
jgi:hypothetical protein